MIKYKFRDENNNFLGEAELKKNKVNSISASSNHKQYPSAKAVYDYVGNIETVLDEIRGVSNEPNIQITTN